MPKISRGRLDGLHGMNSYTSEELYDWADELEAQIKNLKNTEDPKWLKRWAKKLRNLARKKEKSIIYKACQR